MGMIDKVFGTLFGDGRNAVAETIEIFHESEEKGAKRAQDLRLATLAQFGGEFRIVRRGWFDRIMDAVNRVPRPAMALGTLGLFVAAMVDPVWFAARMQGIALVPEPLWWLLGAIVSFYFGARHQAKGQDFQREMAQSVSRASQVMGRLRALDDVARTDEPRLEDASENPALSAWREQAERKVSR